MTHPEVGRELATTELMVKTVVMVYKEGRDVYATLWVTGIGTDYVTFYAGIGNVTFIAKRNADDALEDDTGARIRVYRYLGTV